MTLTYEINIHLDLLHSAGAVHLLEVDFDRPWIRLPCAHHVRERYYDAAVKGKYGEKTESPFQAQCQEFRKWFSANKESIPRQVTYDPLNPPIPIDKPYLKKWRDDLLLLKETLERKGLKFPRGDYDHLWKLVQVMLLKDQFNIKFTLRYEQMLPVLIHFHFIKVIFDW